MTHMRPNETYTQIEAQELTPNDVGEHVILCDEDGESDEAGYLTGFKVSTTYEAQVDADGRYASIDLRNYTVEVELDGDDTETDLYCNAALWITGRAEDIEDAS